MKTKIIFFIILAVFCINIFATESTHIYLARAIASAVGDEAFVVRVHYGEMLMNRVESEEYPNALADVVAQMGINISRKKPTDSDMRAAAAALADMDFCGGALNAKRRTPPANTDFVRLYNWYFY